MNSRKFLIFNFQFLKNRKVFFSFFLCSFFSLLLYFFATSLKAGTTDPVTTHELAGTLGNNGWYISTVDVTLRSSDIESGPKSTTYWLNSEDPTTVNYDIIENQILNPSFEEADRHGFWPLYWYTIRHWGDNDCFPCSALFWQSSSYAKFDWRSGAIGILGSGVYYYQNRDRYITVVSGETYNTSVWVRTLNIGGAPGAWFEIWTRGDGDVDTDTKIAESSKVVGTNDWTLLSTEFTIPVDEDKFYVRLVLEDDGLLGVAWWDGVSMYGGTNFFTDFLIIENGVYNLYYYSTDNNDNVESVNETEIKIDTVAPEKWDNFGVDDPPGDHIFIGFVEAYDVTSGLDVSESYYAYYMGHDDEEWDHDGDDEVDWYPVDSVTVVSTGLPANDGVTEDVEFRTDIVDFKDSSKIMKFQFQALDMAGNISNSPILTIAGAWMQSQGKGEIYVKNGISASSSIPIEGEYNTDSLISIGTNSLSFFTSSSDYLVKNYTDENTGEISVFFQNYNSIRSKAISLPEGKLPELSGIYYYTGDYLLDQNSITSGFENGVIHTLIIFEGNLSIKKEFTINDSSGVVFIVTGDVSVEGDVEEISGYFFSEGVFNSNINAKGKKQLVIKGSVIAKDGITMARDLTRKGNPNNLDTPAESLIFQPKYLFDTLLAQYLGGSQAEIDWSEE